MGQTASLGKRSGMVRDGQFKRSCNGGPAQRKNEASVASRFDICGNLRLMRSLVWLRLQEIYRLSSTNGHYAKISSDGKFRAVISLEDPGVPNWLDPAGFKQGTI
jgi:hypothetical protein